MTEEEREEEEELERGLTLLAKESTRSLFMSLMFLMFLSTGVSAVFSYLYNIYGAAMPYGMLMSLQGGSSVCTFLLAAMLGMCFGEKKVCGFDADWKMPVSLWALSAVAMVVSQPLVEWASYFNMQLLEIPGMEWLRGYVSEVNEVNTPMLSKMLTVDVWWKWPVVMLVVAVLPAVCEEMFFRGVMLRAIWVSTRNGNVAVFLSAIFFSMLHLEADAFLPRVVMGIILGFMYVKTRSLVLPMMAHATNNAMVILACGLSEIPVSERLSEEVTNPGPAGPIVSLFLSYWVCQLLKRVYIKKWLRDRER